IAASMLSGAVYAEESTEAADSTTVLQDATATGVSADNDLVIAIEGGVGSLDPMNYSDTNSISAAGGMYESLVTFDDDRNIVGLLATDWTISDDGLTYTFTLRDDVTFHDGTAFNADAVVANFDRLLDQDLGLSQTARWYKTDEDGNSVARVTVTAVDEYTVEFQLLEGWSSFLNVLTLNTYISPATIEEYGNDLMYHPCGTGPYVFGEWVEGDYVTMYPNEDYWGEVPTVDSVTIKTVPEAGTRTAGLQTGEFDVVYPMTSDQIAAVSGDDTITITSTPSNIMRYVTLNMDVEELSDIRVRQAINYAVDKDAYVEVMYSGYATIADSVFPSTISYYEAQEVYEYDLDKALELMEEAGYADGFDLTIWCDNTTQEIKGATFIQQQLAQININVTVVPYDAGTMDADIYVERDEATVQMWYVNWSASNFSADSTVRALLYSGMEPPVSANTAYYENDDFDSKLDEALLTSDTELQAQLYAECQEIAWADCPWIFLAVDNILSASQSYVSGVSVNPDGRIVFGSASLAQ
ncbi:MAG: ABC transporter substrate-binding protein, partial [Lachnospiraceae bacterium]|nr:ABC transporter substrate-binding protein [Lachnospiraceae bacterium]